MTMTRRLLLTGFITAPTAALASGPHLTDCRVLLPVRVEYRAGWLYGTRFIGDAALVGMGVDTQSPLAVWRAITGRNRA